MFSSTPTNPCVLPLGVPTIFVKIEDYFAPETSQRAEAFTGRQGTPFVVIDKRTIADAYDRLADCLPFARIYYVVKTNPVTEITELLRDKGSNFDIASVCELDKVMKTGVNPERISHGNIIRKFGDTHYFYEKDVRLFVADSEASLRNITKTALGARVYMRILTGGSATADWPLSRKFGCQTDMAMNLLILARQLDLKPCGISFHVGSQQRDISAWDAAIAKVKVIFERLKGEDGTTLKMINMGGGFPANYITKTNDLGAYAEEIIRFLRESLGDDLPETTLEPDRSLITNAGILVNEVVLVVYRSRTAVKHWAYADVDKFSGLVETTDESIKFLIWIERQGEMEEVVIVGSTYDSTGIVCEHYKYGLPLSLASGDRLYWPFIGVYTTNYSVVEFNGFPPLKTPYL